MEFDKSDVEFPTCMMINYTQENEMRINEKPEYKSLKKTTTGLERVRLLRFGLIVLRIHFKVALRVRADRADLR